MYPTQTQLYPFLFLVSKESLEICFQIKITRTHQCPVFLHKVAAIIIHIIRELPTCTWHLWIPSRCARTIGSLRQGILITFLHDCLTYSLPVSLHPQTPLISHFPARFERRSRSNKLEGELFLMLSRLAHMVSKTLGVTHHNWVNARACVIVHHNDSYLKGVVSTISAPPQRRGPLRLDVPKGEVRLASGNQVIWSGNVYICSPQEKYEGATRTACACILLTCAPVTVLAHGPCICMHVGICQHANCAKRKSCNIDVTVWPWPFTIHT